MLIYRIWGKDSSVASSLRMTARVALGVAQRGGGVRTKRFFGRKLPQDDSPGGARRSAGGASVEAFAVVVDYGFKAHAHAWRRPVLRRQPDGRACEVDCDFRRFCETLAAQ